MNNLKRHFKNMYGESRKNHLIFYMRIVILVMVVTLMLAIFPLGKVSFHKYSSQANDIMTWQNYEIIDIAQGKIQQSFLALGNELEEIAVFFTDIESKAPFEIEYLLSDKDNKQVAEGKIVLSWNDSNQYVKIPLKLKVVANQPYVLTLNLQGNDTIDSCGLVSLSKETAPSVSIQGQYNNEELSGNLAGRYLYKMSPDKKEVVYAYLILGTIAIILLFGEILISRKWLGTFLIAMVEFSIMLTWYCEKLREIMDEIPKLKIIYLIFCLIIICITVAQSYKLFTKKKNRPENFFVWTTFFWGIVYIILLPPFGIHDELTHFSESNFITNGIMQMEPKDENGHIYLRTEDAIDYQPLLNKDYFVKYYANTFKAANTRGEYQVLDYPDNKGIGGLASHAYIPYVLANLVARGLNLNYVMSMTLGALIGMAFYLAIVYKAIAITPIGKWTFYIVSQLPAAYQIFTGYTYDLMNMALIFLTIAYLLYLLYEKESVGIKQFVIFAVLCILWCPIKIAYFPLCFAIFMIPKEKIILGRKKALVCKILVVLSGLAATSSQRLSEILIGFTRTKEIQANPFNANSLNELISTASLQSEAKYMIQDLLDDKFKIISLLFNTIFEKLEFYWSGMFGTYLGWGQIMIPNYIVNGFIILVLFSLFAQIPLNGKVKKNHKIGTVLIGLACCGAIAAGLLFNFTPNSLNYILGIQPRYFIVLLPLLIVLFSNDKIAENAEPKAWIWVLGGTFLNMLVVFRTYYYILSI